MIDKKSIMIISNDTEIRSMLASNLRDRGYEVFSTAESGDSLKVILDKTAPDLVIISLGINCLEAVELSLRIRRWNQIPIILVNDMGNEQITDRGGSGCCVVKNNTMEDLLLKVRNSFSQN